MIKYKNIKKQYFLFKINESKTRDHNFHALITHIYIFIF